MMNAVEVKNLRFSYIDKPVIKDISFAVPPGTFTAIIGPNGSGKTTLMRLISAALKPDAGCVMINGKQTGELSARALARSMAFVPQKPEAIPFSVMDVVLMGRYAYMKRFSGPGSSDMTAVKDAISQARLEGYENRPLNLLSGGEQQRVFIAKALAQQAGVLLLDEPIAGLDISYQLEILRIVKRLCVERGTTVLCVLHDINLAYTLADMVAVISSGELDTFDSPEQAIDERRLERVYETKMTSLTVDDGHRYFLPVF